MSVVKHFKNKIIRNFNELIFWIMKQIGYFFFLIFLISCSDTEYPIPLPGADKIDCETAIITQNKFYEDEDGNRFLWAGENPETHFKINNFSLDICQLKYGLGREHFKALITPQYVPISEVIDQFDNIEKTIILKTGSGVKVFPFSILVQHELINEWVNGQPVMVVYCFLADLAAVYHRTYCNEQLTFGVSGYTYCDRDISDGLESFVLWDRDTESLWWPINGKGVSGAFQGKNMEVLSSSKWEEMRWEQVKEQYPNALILKNNQTMEVPENWENIPSSQIHCL